MDLLDWARGPLLAAALLVFCLGCGWRLAALRSLPPAVAAGQPRQPYGRGQAWRAAAGRLAVRQWLPASATLATVNPYLYHLGLALVVFGYAPHIDFIRRLTGLSWPALPDGVMYAAAGATIVSLCIALLYRLTDPVLRLISSGGDYIAWIVTMLPLLTGMALIVKPGAGAADPTRLAIHLLSLELLLAWFPFGKLMHAFLVVPGRAQLGAFLARRGVRA